MPKLKVLFVCSGNNPGGMSPNVRVQAEGLMKAGVDVSYFLIRGKGLRGYSSAAFTLRRFLRNEKYDVIHAHYGLSGIAASMAGAGPLVVTIMGSEFFLNRVLRSAVMFFIRNVWEKTIVQSLEMKKAAGSDDVVVLPNGIDVDKFRTVDVKKAKEHTGFKTGKHIIWVSDPSRPEKNFALAQKTAEVLGDGFELNAVYGKPHDEMPFYFKAADALLLTSKWEGSPIVVKEALAAGLPVVSVDVGDVRKWLDGNEGCFVTEAKPEELADALKKAVQFKGVINAYDKVSNLEISKVSERLKEIYLSVMK
jgi:glycosyltransferase involved in cell wall biosynthesis